jgi:hypothetical protein
VKGKGKVMHGAAAYSYKMCTHYISRLGRKLQIP